MTEDRFAAARAALLGGLRRKGIRDERVLAAMAAVPREAFVPADQQHDAYLDVALPIGEMQTISQPYIVAAMTAALALEPHHSVLEIGTGSGYQAAILSHLCRQVSTIERYQQLSDEARKRFAALGIGNVDARWGDGFEGWPERAPFDRIILTAVTDRLPPILLQQLAPDGVMVLPLEDASGEQELVRVTRDAGGAVHLQRLISVRFVPMLPGTRTR